MLPGAALTVAIGASAARCSGCASSRPISHLHNREGKELLLRMLLLRLPLTLRQPFPTRKNTTGRTHAYLDRYTRSVRLTGLMYKGL